jgi:hypothetical protein
MTTTEQKEWRIVRTVELHSSSTNVWEVVGGFFNIHLWHPDIENTEIPADQTSVSPLRRILTFPGQPKTTEELVSLENKNYFYDYKWHSGQWGEEVKNYRARIHVFDTFMSDRCMVQWSSTFRCNVDAVSEFYERGFAALKKRFG